MIQSMTAFARAELTGEWGRVSIELRSVNHRYLDMSFRIPEKLRVLESDFRGKANELLNRGKVECYVHFVQGDELALDVSVNAALINALCEAEKIVQAQSQRLDGLSVERLLMWPGALQLTASTLEQVHKPIVDLFIDALHTLNEARNKEGARLATFIERRLASVKEEASKASAIFEQSVVTHKAKLLDRFEQLALDVDSARVEQELVLMLQKLDVTEELDRLMAHLHEVSSIIQKGGVVGRRLDFLMQELNREANTLSSKSVDTELTRVAVEIKVLIEQMREQVQNIV